MTTETKPQTITIAPPPSVCGMTVLDRDKFQAEVEVPYLIIPAEKSKVVLKHLKPYLFKMPKLQPVQAEDCKRKVLLHPQKFEKNLELLQKLFCELNLGNAMWTKLQLRYENWSSDDIFKAVLPNDTVGNVSSFSIIGHIIHLNLKPDLLNYKYLIGKVLLDKYSNIKTVVNKSENIGNTFRNFKIEHLAGEENYHVLVKENNIQYAFDFEKVFWNPRLVTEHMKMVTKVNVGDTVFDVFAGVGPFAVPLAKKKCQVLANDLNPDSYHWLCHNAKLNKVGEYLQAFNLDGNIFIKTVVKNGLIKYFNRDHKKVSNVHILMNLPAAALTFLQSFNGLLAGESVLDTSTMPTVHCYFFKKKDEDATDIVNNYLDKNLMCDAEIDTVRLVAPNKLMMRVTYKLTKNILFLAEDSTSEPSAKRMKMALENNDEILINDKNSVAS